MKTTVLFTVIFASVLAPAGVATAQLDLALVGWWPMDEGQGATALDRSGNGHDGTLVGDPLWVEGVLGGALHFNHTTINDVVAIPAFDIEGTGITLAAWTKPDRAYTLDGRIINKATSTSGVENFWWRLSVRHPGTQNGLQMLLRTDVGSTTEFITPAADLVIGEWCHVAGTWDSESQAIILYKDGVERGRTAKTGTAVATNPDVAVTIGNQFQDGSTTIGARPWHGAVDDVQIYRRALSQSEIEGIMSGLANLSQAQNPSPANETVDVPRDVVLAWEAGQFAATHDVYFGTAFDDVNDAGRAAPMGVLVSQGQTAMAYDPPELLDFGTTYYWRIDEVNAPPSSTIFKGNVWSFMTEPLAYPLTGVTATSSGISQANAGPDKAVDSSGLNAADQHSTVADDMWLTSPDGAEPLWIQFEFDRVYKLHELWVWNYNVQFEVVLGFGLKDVAVEYSQDGVDWAALGDFELAKATASSSYAHNTTIDMAGVAAKYVRLNVNSGWGQMGQFGLSEVRFLYIPAHAREPQPADGAADVDPDVVLNWRAGRDAASHDVYLGADPDALDLVDTVDVARLSPEGVEYGATYYWRIDEVNEADATAVWEGDLWSFSTQPYAVVDDFESYTDDIDAGQTIFQTWIDGYEDPQNGSMVGHLDSPFAEQTIVHGGRQSMPLFYDNTGVTMAEAEYAFDAQDWTANGLKSLSLYFYGASGNSGQLYVRINNTKIVYDGAATDVTKEQWQAWNIDLSTVGGDLSRVTKLTVGIEGAGASGVLYIDDIRLYPRTPEFITPIEPDSAALLAHYDFESGQGTTLLDRSGNGNNGAIIGAQWLSPGWDGQSGRCLRFDGQGTNRVDLGVLDVAGSGITIASWSNAYNLDTPGNDPRLVSKANGGAGENHWWATGSCRLDGEKRIRFRLKTDGGTAEIQSGPTGTIETNEWIHIAATWDGATMRTYKNGVQVHSLARGGTISTDPSVKVAIGNQPQGAEDRPWDGLIDEVRIYERALSEEEILWLAGQRDPMHKPL